MSGKKIKVEAPKMRGPYERFYIELTKDVKDEAGDKTYLKGSVLQVRHAGREKYLADGHKEWNFPKGTPKALRPEDIKE